MEFFKPTTTNKAGRVLFYIFEIFAACVLLLGFILSIVASVLQKSFMSFVADFMQVVYQTLIIFGLGRIVDLLYTNKK